MKRILILPLFLSLLSGCLEKKNRAFFTDDGITLGEPKVVEGGGLFIPIDFKTRIIHSAQWLYDVEWKQKDNKITITALFSVPPDMKKSVYQGGITLKAGKLSFYDAYRIQYRDPDGKTHYVGEVRTRPQGSGN
jgi:hypothetical protein